MCIWFEVIPLHDNPAEAHNAGGLADAVGCAVRDLPTISDTTMESDECLCDLDIEAFELKFGYRHEVGETSFDNRLVEVSA
ncbi:hypothetical protein N4P55_06735 [Pseudomonas fluorescens]|uniref:hypothetical protein n=1 Tax=Pseudomonas fluorescens TaxID=294 RepID=UPI0021D16239|nr:hypothetical protein [Pseudomonas fluorescens]UXV21046.1 hypothetical protein N4P55_06735 [Pseudomonas fluorescens]